jgi:putative transposase
VGRACRVVHLQRSLWYYRSIKDDSAIQEKLAALARQFPTRGFDKYYGIIRLQGHKWARSRVLRVYREMKLSKRRRHKKRLPSRIKEPLQKQLLPNQSYSMDFMSDSLVSGRKLRILKVVDDCTRESLALWCDFSITGEKVTEVLEQVIRERGKPSRSGWITARSSPVNPLPCGAKKKKSPSNTSSQEDPCRTLISND